MVNIFFISENPERAAQYSCNKHVVKMIVESAQLLSSVHHWVLQNEDEEWTYIPSICYKVSKSQMNHPCAIWVRQSLSNYKWLCRHAVELCNEYTRRYEKIHSTETLILKLCVYFPPIEDKGLTPPAQAMPEEYKNENAVEAYRTYYINDKMGFAVWPKGEIPYFIPDEIIEEKHDKFIIVSERKK
jgi:hypothetical protein